MAVKVGLVGTAPDDSIGRIVESQSWPSAPDVATLSSAFPDIEAILERAGDRWQARLAAHPEWSPLCVDFTERRFSENSMRLMGRSSPLGRALGIGKSAEPPRALDATAGLGADAFAIAWLGCETLALERNPVACALLLDGLARAPRSPAASRLTAEFADSIEWMRAPPAEKIDLVYLDPMYANPDERSALPKKSMQLFRALLGDDPQEERELLDAALACAQRRVVVKRHPRAPHLAGRVPTATFSSKSVRFDAYIRPPP